MSNAIFVDSQATALLAKRIVGDAATVDMLSYLTIPLPDKLPKRDFTGKKNFFFVGRLNPVKRVPLAVKAIAWLRERGMDATLRIYGRDDGDQLAVESAISTYGLGEFVSIEGEIGNAEKGALYASHNYYIQLSTQEGMAMSVAEAMQQGVICFVTPVGGIAQYAVDGLSAIFAQTENEESWHRSLHHLWDTLQDSVQCKAISDGAYRVFKDMPIFADSLIAAINYYEKKKK